MSDRSAHILIVEDNPSDADLMEATLRRAGLDVLCERVEHEAAFLAALDRADLILADHSLPDFGAQRVLELVRAHSARTPVIVVTGLMTDEEAAAYMQAGAQDYLLKSHLARLPAAVEAAMERVRLEQVDAEMREARRAAGDHLLSNIERRLDRHEQALDEHAKQLDRLNNDIYGDTNLRSGPLSLFERLDRMESANARRFDDLAQLIQTHEKQIKTWLTWQRLAGGVLVAFLNLPFLKWLKKLLALTVTVALGTACGGSFFLTFLLHVYR